PSISFSSNDELQQMQQDPPHSAPASDAPAVAPQSRRGCESLGFSEWIFWSVFGWHPGGCASRPPGCAGGVEEVRGTRDPPEPPRLSEASAGGGGGVWVRAAGAPVSALRRKGVRGDFANYRGQGQGVWKWALEGVFYALAPWPCGKVCWVRDFPSYGGEGFRNFVFPVRVYCSPRTCGDGKRSDSESSRVRYGAIRPATVLAVL
ncbi:hypothetical protein AMTR_s00237p00022130, partial [Amborella trichopoda]